ERRIELPRRETQVDRRVRQVRVVARPREIDGHLALPPERTGLRMRERRVELRPSPGIRSTRLYAAIRDLRDLYVGRREAHVRDRRRRRAGDVDATVEPARARRPPGERAQRLQVDAGERD